MSRGGASGSFRLAISDSFADAVKLQKQGNLPAAEKLYRVFLKQYPKHFGTLYNLGLILSRTGRFEEAAALLHRAVAQEPKSVDGQIQLAWTLQQVDRQEEAIERATQAIALDPRSAEAHDVLASGLAFLGQYDEATRAQAKAIELAPDRPRFYYQWGHLTRWTADDPRLAALVALTKKPLPIEEQAYRNYALGKAYSDCGDIERAFRYQIAGGAAKRQTLRYDEASVFRQWKALCRAFDVEWIRKHRDVGDPSPLPVFILGMPRSGSTLIEQILSAHPKVRALGETPLFADALTRVRGKPNAPPSLAQIAAPWSNVEVRRLGALYVQFARRNTPPSVARVVDKVPDNHRFAGLIHAALPNGRIIHSCRDPVDTCLSIFSMLFTGDAQSYSYDLSELGRYYRAYREMMAHWRSAVPTGVMLEVRYEELVEDFEQQARRIIAHCGLEWDDACLKFYNADRPVRTASHAQVRQPIYRSSVGRPRPPRELLMPLLEALGQTQEASSARGAGA